MHHAHTSTHTHRIHAHTLTHTHLDEGPTHFPPGSQPGLGRAKMFNVRNDKRQKAPHTHKHTHTQAHTHTHTHTHRMRAHTKNTGTHTDTRTHTHTYLDEIYVDATAAQFADELQQEDGAAVSVRRRRTSGDGDHTSGGPGPEARVRPRVRLAVSEKDDLCLGEILVLGWARAKLPLALTIC